jgi:type II secretory pathway component PulJ
MAQPAETETHSEIETGKLFYERTMPAIAQHLAPLAKIGAQLEQLNRNLEALAHLLERQAAPRPPFRGRGQERRPAWKKPRRRWEPGRAEEARPSSRQRERYERETGPRHNRNR